MTPRSATPSPTNSMTSFVRTKSTSRSKLLDTRDEAPVVLVEDQARVVQQRQGRLDETALVRDRKAEAVAHALGPDGVGDAGLAGDREPIQRFAGSRPRRG